jgi:hypothetical protein
LTNADFSIYEYNGKYTVHRELVHGEYTVTKHPFIDTLRAYNDLDVISLSLIHRSFLESFTVMIPDVSDLQP